MPAVTEAFSVHVDQPGLPHSHAYTAAGPVAEGAGDGVGNAAAPVKGNAMRKAFLILSGLVLVAAAVCGIGYFVFLHDNGGSTSATPDTNGVPDSGPDSAVTTERGEAGASPGSEEAPDDDGAEEAPADDDSTAEGSPEAPTDDSTDTPAVTGAPANSTAGTNAIAPSVTPAAAPVAVNTTPPVLQSVPVTATLGAYDAPTPLSVIPVAVAVLPSGKVLAWSAESPDDFYRDNRYIESGGGQGFTYHSIYDPAIDVATPMLISNTEHDMFCPGITMMANGDILVTGGQNAKKASIYQLATNKWVAAAEMSISRGYGSSALLSNGKVFVLGGSWSGPKDVTKDAEIYNPTLGTWTSLPGIQAAFILTDDPEDAELGVVYRADNYGMFHSWSDATIFHAGPSQTMFWFDTNGTGSALQAGQRPGGNIANGNSIMYDAGKILNCGGSESFAWEEYPATDVASIVTLAQPNTQVSVREISGMNLPRVYANAVVLPDGKVLINGGASHPKEFTDVYAHYQPEIWDPATEEFTLLSAKHVKGRTYHSTAALLPDGRVVTGGGGLCGSGASGEPSLCKGDVDPNHLDFEIFNPPYLFAADGSLAARPNITLSAATARHGSSIKVTSSEQLMMVSLIRMGSATHSTNTDQRRIELCGPFTKPCAMSPVTVTVPADPGIALAGNWMVFGVNAMGVPSVSATLLVGGF